MRYQDLKKLISAPGREKTAIEVLSSQKRKVKIDILKKQWDPEKHDVCNISKRKKREVKREIELSDGSKRTETVLEDVVRVPIPMQKYIVNKATTFLFGNNVNLKCQPKDNQEKVLTALSIILDDAKSESKNREIAKYLFKSTQVAEIWYPDEVEEHVDYGFKTKFRLRLMILSPWDGDDLYPFFDDRSDLIAFSRRYTISDENGKDIECFETYTQDFIITWQKPSGSDWLKPEVKDNIIKKIPVVFAEQEHAEWYDVQRAISRLEDLLSNHGQINDYSADPLLLAKGEVLTLPEKGRVGGRLLEVEAGGDAKYISWDQAPESIKLEIENLFKVIHTYTQTPEISFESVKGIGAVSGIALKLLFMDAHLKVMDKREIFDPYLKRRINILKAYIGAMNLDLKEPAKTLRVEPEIIPYIIEDMVEKVTALVTANGGKAIISQKASVDKAGLVEDKVKDYNQIVQEDKEAKRAVPFEI